MVKPKTHGHQQSNKMDNYAIARQASTPLEQDSAEPGVYEPSLGAIMEAVSDLKSALEPKLDTVTVDVSLLHADLQKMADKISTAESDIQTLRSTSKSLEEQVRTLTAQHATMAARLEDQEGHARRNNFRVIRVPERAAGVSVDFFLEDLILKTLCPKRLSNFFLVEREHRTPGAPPRIIIGRIFNHRARDAILQAACTHVDLHYENSIIRFFPDYTLQVQKQCCSFDELKKALHAKELKHMIRFPARLRVLAEGKSWYLAADAWDWIEGWGQRDWQIQEKGKGEATRNQQQAGSPGSPQDHGGPGEM
ncbi:hypothetical protein NDU88_000928 [Pleurodeles waltl]|uniref:LINE-1 type transposase domain-containing 1 n=1 Tax=Pleurodeles waltl TaxID=8319 RepID=A0AAV7TH72_PLEWA|nr:hypothetical protein NDU88_000928 [Pleurodeles waltl]